MENVEKRAVTYSVLAHIREGGGVVKSNIDTFAPLVKKSLAHFAKGQAVKSNTTIDIKNFILEEYGILIPLPVVNTILDKVAKEIVAKSGANCQLFADGAFIIESYDFDILDNIHTSHTEEIRELEDIFNAFCSEEALSGKDYSNVFTFIESSQSSIGQYLTEDEPVRELPFTTEARFVEYVKDIPSAYATVRKIYIGSLLVSYIKYPASEAKVDMELVFDTNFLIGLLNLSTEESNETCQTLLNIGRKQGFVLTVLQDTIDETENLLRSKARNFGVSFLTNKIYPEDIYNACDRLGYGTADLERIADNLTSLITKLGVQLIPHTETYRNKAKFSSEYTK